MLKHSHFHDRRFSGDAQRLRSPGRVALLEVDRVVSLCLEGLSVRTVLDVGTGTGIFAEAFAGTGLEVTGVDANSGLLEAARRHAPSVRFMEATAEELPFEADSFDLVFLGHVLHETDDPLAALREGRRVARIRVGILEWPYREDEQGPPLAHRISPETVTRLAESAGYRTVETRRLSHMDFYRLTP